MSENFKNSNLEKIEKKEATKGTEGVMIKALAAATLAGCTFFCAGTAQAAEDIEQAMTNRLPNETTLDTLKNSNLTYVDKKKTVDTIYIESTYLSKLSSTSKGTTVYRVKMKNNNGNYYYLSQQQYKDLLDSGVLYKTETVSTSSNSTAAQDIDAWVAANPDYTAVNPIYQYQKALDNVLPAYRSKYTADSGYVLETPEGGNTITKYTYEDDVRYYDKATGEEVAADNRIEGNQYLELTRKKAVAHEYQVNLKQNNYGEGSGKTYFDWVSENNNYLLNKFDSATNTRNSITVSHNNTNTLSSINNTGNYTAPITGTFLGYKDTTNNNHGAIVNSGQIDTINVDFIGNEIGYIDEENNTSASSAYGPAIYNYGNINTVTGTFAGNTAKSSYSYGGAINLPSNKGHIGVLNGNFIGNKAIATYSAYGGALYASKGGIDEINANFIGNTAISTKNQSAYGGAIAIGTGGGGDVGNITGNIINNGAIGGSIYGGAIFSQGNIGDITGDFIGNYANGSFAYGGAIYNTGNIGDIKGDFIANHIISTGGAFGGALSVKNVSSITGDFIGNYIESRTTGYGGAIYSANIIGDLTGNFYDNHIKVSEGNAYGGVLSNVKIGGNLTGNFSGNNVEVATFAGGGVLQQVNVTGNIVGNFTDNHITSSTNSGSYGGAIYDTTANSLTGDFINNTIDGAGYGGAIQRITLTEDLTGNFIGNHVTNGSYTSGGAIYSGTVRNLTGDFIDNYAHGDGYNTGGAISGLNITGNLEGNFINNRVISNTNEADGGAIYGNYGNSSRPQNIFGNFIGNYAEGLSNVIGGAIYNYGAAGGNIEGDFIGNYVLSHDGTNSYAQGGAGQNVSASKLLGNIIDNHATGNTAYGGAFVSFSGSLIQGDIKNNYAEVPERELSGGYVMGGALHNGSVGQIIGDITGNHVKTSTLCESYGYGYAQGGAIKDVSVGRIEGNIIGNYAEVTTNLNENSYAEGGAIHKLRGSTLIYDSNINNNYAKAAANHAYGGALFIDTNILLQQVNLTGNYAEVVDSNGTALGGAIYALSNPQFQAYNNFESTIKNNYVKIGDKTNYQAIYLARENANLTLIAFNNGKFNIYDSIDGVGPYTLTLNGDPTGTINFISSGKDHLASFNNANLIALGANPINFKYADGAISEYTANSIKLNNTFPASLELDIDANTKTADTITAKGDDSSGIIKITAIKFVNNDELRPTSEFVIPILKLTANSTMKLDIADNLLYPNSELVRTEVRKSDTISPNVAWGEHFESYDDVTRVYGKLSLVSEHTEDENIEGIGVVITDVVQSNENIATLDNTLKLWASQTVEEGTERNFSTNDAQEVYTVNEDLGNPTEGVLNINGKTDGDNHSTIDLNGNKGFVLTEKTTINLNDVKLTGNENLLTVENEFTEVNLKDVYLDGNIEATADYKMHISGETTLTGTVDRANVTVNDATLNLPSYNHFENATVEFQNGTLNLINGRTENQLAKDFKVTGNMTVNLDADLANHLMDRLPSNTKVSESGVITVKNIHLTSDARSEETYIPFAYEDFKKQVNYGGEKELEYTGGNTIAYAPIFKYKVSYNPEDGQFLFARGGGFSGSNNYQDYNPTVLATPIAAESGATATMGQTMNYAFQNSDNFMAIPYLERVAMKTKNRYALSPTGDATDVGTFSPLFTQPDGSSAWVKPYASFENIPLKNGPKVSNITYGTLIGVDTAVKELRHGWTRSLTGYIGYNGASQRYAGVNTTQNGGLIGGTITMYKKNFFNATTLSTGAIVGENHNMFGHENYTMLMAGIGNKTGYNLEFKEGKYIIQPNFLMSYTFVNTFDYTNSAGVRMKSDPLHAVQLAPGVKFIGNFGNGWQPYIGVNMVWNLLDKSDVYADNVKLPEMSIKPYVQYGVGVQKRVKDHFMAYGQAMIQNGGRNGISMSAGFRWALGHKDKDNENKVEKIKKEKLVKQETKKQVVEKVQTKTVIKQMTDATRRQVIKNNKDTSRTSNIAVIKY